MRRLLALTVLMLLVAAACNDTAVTPDVTPTPAEGAAPADVELGETELGSVLVDAEGMTLYLFTRDSEDTSACVDQCAETWPPLRVVGEPVAGDGVDAGLMGTLVREDGFTQASYGGHPLYSYEADQAPGDVNGHGVNDVWFAVGPDGNAIAADN